MNQYWNLLNAGNEKILPDDEQDAQRVTDYQNANMASKGECEELRRERARATFTVRELTHVLDCGEENTARRKELEAIFYDDPELIDKVPPDYLTHKEIYDESFRKCMVIFRQAMEMSDPRECLRIADGILHEATPVGIHYLMFLPAILGQANEEQQSKWLPMALEMEMIGTYAQTELGHGTFVKGLETTATYDIAREEFILNSPTLTSIKWWPGGLGKAANHAIVLAQLYIKDVCYGIHPFMVQIRKIEDHMPVPGVMVGEIGPKMGIRASDNGFLKLDNLRIPRENMLMKNSEVTRDGKYIKPKSEKLKYGTMVFVRVLIMDMAAFNLGRAVTIAIRYSCVRKQSEMVPGEGEVQILEYPAQQYKLFPSLALTHALKATFASLVSTYKDINQDLERGEMETLPELHALSSGLKAYSSDMASRYIEICRMACGGHGYLLISGLPRLYANTVASCTYEGENTVLYLQTARFLVKCVNGQHSLSSKSIAGYLLQKEHEVIQDRHPPTDLFYLVKLHRAAAYIQIHEAAKTVQSLMDAGKSIDLAFSMGSVQLIRAAKAHVQYYVAMKYVDWLGNLQISKELRTVLTNLCNLFLLHNVWENSGLFMAAGVTYEEQRTMYEQIMKLLPLIRSEAVSLVDAFDYHDQVLCSALGSYDGKVYERMFEWAQKSPLNEKQVVDAFEKYVVPARKAKL